MKVSVVFVHPDGREFPFEWNAPAEYEEHDAWYYFHEGNFSCDCNRGIVMGLGDELPCGETIALKDFQVHGSGV